MVRRYQALRSLDGTPTFEQIGAELGITKQAVKFALGNVLRKMPETATLFPRMAQTFRPSQMRIHPADPSAPEQQFLPLG